MDTPEPEKAKRFVPFINQMYFDMLYEFVRVHGPVSKKEVVKYSDVPPEAIKRWLNSRNFRNDGHNRWWL